MRLFERLDPLAEHGPIFRPHLVPQRDVAPTVLSRLASIKERASDCRDHRRGMARPYPRRHVPAEFQDSGSVSTTPEMAGTVTTAPLPMGRTTAPCSSVASVASSLTPASWGSVHLKSFSPRLKPTHTRSVPSV